MDEPMHEITGLLKDWGNGDHQALDRLMPLVDRELHKIAQNYMRHENPGHILQTTALVNEALIRLIRENMSFENRKHFYGIVAKRMRQVLYDYARERNRAKRGGGAKQVELSDVKDEQWERSKEILMLEQALTKLGQIDERKLTIIESRFFIGLTYEEIAELIGISPATVQNDWRFARSWLKTEMTEESPTSPG
jgi:RNA polymerase sigma-70 factor, ECF subfamily